MNRERTDAAAHNHLRHQVANHLDGKIGREAFTCDCGEEHVLYEPGDFDDIAEAVADAYTVTFQRYVNDHGVPVRRVVAYGPEECDPTVPSAAAAAVAGEPALEPAAA